MDPTAETRPLPPSLLPPSFTHTNTRTHTSSLSLSLSLVLSVFLSISQSVIMEPSSPKKIQFAVPPLQAQLDPQAAEHIRRRRPTPATLQIYRQPGTDVGEQHASEDAQPSDASQRNQSSYTQPSMKEIQQGVEQQLLGAGVCEADSQQSPITAQLYATSSLWANHNGPEEPNGNEASLMLANQERGVEESNSSGDLSCDHKMDASSPGSVSR
ncbi:uncharacterized protein LOC130533472 isoform X2 [Takifugu flavidus]|uniref:uncharacterized protein LOC130533472 isoform X2 n=1 Tax=Takifugu flavidus TaxID=433684 RepID=UPI0025448090|nr:uncharacterized protein LOC130533472 isoform X2 [Takifugu flavidus]